MRIIYFDVDTHVRGRLPAYLERLRATGRERWADRLERAHPGEL